MVPAMYDAHSSCTLVVCRTEDNGLQLSDLVSAWDSNGDGALSKKELLIHMKQARAGAYYIAPHVKGPEAALRSQLDSALCGSQ